MSFVWCGDDMGCITRVPLNGRSSESKPTEIVAPHRLGFHYQKGSAPRRVHCLAWAGVRSSADSDSSSSSAAGAWDSLEREVLVGFKSGLVELYNAQSKELLASFDALSLTGALQAAASSAHKPIDPSTRAPQQLNATSALVGMTVLQGGGGSASSSSSASSFERRLLTCSEAGVVHIRPFSTLSIDGSERSEEDEDVKPLVAAAAAAAAAKAKRAGKKGASPSLSSTPAPSAAAAAPSSGSSSFVVGSHICVLKVEPVAQSVFACGGKEHLLRLWDLPTSREIWKEKNVAHDMLNLRQQVWITDLAFVPHSAGRELVTGTAYHQVRAYDTRLECKRPIYSSDLFGDPRAVTCIDVSADTNYIIVGDSEGRLQQLDRRKNARMVHVYKGFAGSVRSIQAHETLPLLAACGLDRKLRVYDVKTRAQVHAVYLKQKLNALLFSAETPLHKKAREDAEAAAAAAAEAASGGDDVWLHGIKKEAGVADDDEELAAGAGAARPGLYVKKRKTTAQVSDDEEQDELTVERASGAGDKKKKQKIKVKIEPVDEDEAPAPSKKAAAASAASSAPSASSHTASFKALAPGSSKSKAQSLALARGAALSQVGPAQAGQIVFKQAIDFESDEDDDDDEQGEDDDGEDEDGEGEDDGENAAMEDAEEDEEEEKEAPPARRTRRSPKLAPTPAPAAKRAPTRAAAKKR